MNKDIKNKGQKLWKSHYLGLLKKHTYTLFSFSSYQIHKLLRAFSIQLYRQQQNEKKTQWLQRLLFNYEQREKMSRFRDQSAAFLHWKNFHTFFFLYFSFHKRAILILLIAFFLIIIEPPFSWSINKHWKNSKL